jgi:hypothetical protein
MWQSLGVYFFSNKNYSELFEYNHVFKMFASTCIWNKYTHLKIDTSITCLIYTISMHFLHEKTTNPFDHAKCMECDCFHGLSSSRWTTTCVS